MPARQTHPSDEWQLGPEPSPDELAQLPPRLEPAADLSAARLERPLAVVTVEHVAWALVALWAIITRFAALGAKPFDPAEARRALFAYDLVNATHYAAAADYHPVWSGWVHGLEAALFAICGSGDTTSRLIFVAAGLLMVAIAFAMRPYIGRAGALCLGSLVSISPSFTYFSRSDCSDTVADSTAMLSVMLFMALRRKPTLTNAIGLGFVAGLLAAAGPSGIVTAAILLAALALTGLVALIVTDNAWLRVRVWFTRYGSLPAAVLVTAGLVWSASELVLFQPIDAWHGIRQLWAGDGLRSYAAGLRYYVSLIAFYDFFIALTAVGGIVAIVSLRVRSRFALFSLLWLILGMAYFLWSPDRQPGYVLEMLLPAAIVGAFGVDYLHRSEAWRFVRPLLIALGIVTIYVQILTNFVYFAPNTSEAPWARHANLYWREAATTLQARDRLDSIRGQFPHAGGSVFNPDPWQPVMRWYLRDFRDTSSANLADLVIIPHPTGGTSGNDQFESSYIFDLSETWWPPMSALSPTRALRFIFTGAAWGPFEDETIGVTVRPPAEMAPTVIVPPEQRPLPTPP
ncbi:MAG TPA: hypothetical protein VJN94_06540 [Candidatus Binataceae bacterium]|nr:hypothetical protein [Candidatus Binataceae bacterium]